MYIPNPFPKFLSSVPHSATRRASAFFNALAASINLSRGTTREGTEQGYCPSSILSSAPSSETIISFNLFTALPHYFDDFSLFISITPPPCETIWKGNQAYRGLLQVPKPCVK